MIDLNGWTLRPEYQTQVHNKTIEYCKDYSGAAIVEGSVGCGKSLLIAAISKHVAEKGGKVLVLSRQAEIIDQNSKEAWSVGLKNSIYSASLSQKSTFYPVVFGTEQTVLRSLKDEFKNKSFNLILIDEAHHGDVFDLNKLITEENHQPESAYGKIIKHFTELSDKTRIIGYTGTPYRGKTCIFGDFWTNKLCEISTMQLISLGYLVPPVFGFGSDDEHNYDLSEFNRTDEHEDYTKQELLAMQRKITKDQEKTANIICEVIERTNERNGVLITCAGKKHCEQVSKMLPPDSWTIITDDTGNKKRVSELTKVKEGKIKYVLQVGCLTTGFNAPIIDTIVILRRIGSLTLLIQLIGRGLRILKDNQVESGIQKHDALVLDYTDTLESMGEIFDDPILNKAIAAKKREDDNFIECPKCGQHNSEFAVRCINGSGTDERCDYFFKYNECKKCGTHNAPTAQSCRSCDSIMIDPSKALVNKAYTDADYKQVIRAEWGKTKSGDGIRIQYILNSTYHKDGQEFQEKATEFFKPFSSQNHDRGRWSKFLNDHLNQGWHQTVRRMRSIDEIIKNKAMFDIPMEITHRVNDKGFSIINRKKFRTGREAMAS